MVSATEEPLLVKDTTREPQIVVENDNDDDDCGKDDIVKGELSLNDGRQLPLPSS
jgi:hypothetical protein